MFIYHSSLYSKPPTTYLEKLKLTTHFNNSDDPYVTGIELILKGYAFKKLYFKTCPAESFSNF